MRLIFRCLRRLSRCTSGNALLETTIIMPLILSIMAGAVDFGLALTTQATLSKSMRNAARYLATLPPGAVCTWGLVNAQNLAVYGKLNPVYGVDQPLISGWNANGGSDNYVRLGSNTDCAEPVVVQLKARVPLQTYFLSIALPNATALTLSAEHEERVTGG
ncbi:MAG TPA: TadE/TadG family type IV pilus assembly protein [Xanthobacteraceae bacterium]|nr:TadE/TadG family type IV pilus assembly protein [Xanthobacteraceae bacterium]